MFKKVVYQVTEDWLEDIVIPSKITNREYLTKARIYNRVYDILMEHRYKVFNFNISIANDRVTYIVRVTTEGVDVYVGKKVIYEKNGLMPSRFDDVADWLAWKMVDDR